MDKCKFDKSWVGQCSKTALPFTEYCEEHFAMECHICGEQADHDCEVTMGAFVCGTKLCNKCESNHMELAHKEPFRGF